MPFCWFCHEAAHTSLWDVLLQNKLRFLFSQFDCISLLPLDLFYLINMTVNPWLRLPRLLKVLTFQIFEPRHDKTDKACVRPAKTQISLGIRPF